MTSSPGARFAAVVLASAAITASGCTGVLGLDGYQDALERACKCAADDVGLLPACVDLAEQRFGSASEEVVKGWLGAFAACPTCGAMSPCWDRQPFCAPQGGACAASEQCCGHSVDVIGCDGVCGACLDCANQKFQTDLTSPDLCGDVPPALRACVEGCVLGPCKTNCFLEHCG